MTPRRVVAGRYRLEERIGSGAMGVVWRGTDVRLGRVVAIKQVFLHGGLDEAEADEVRQRTLREGRIAARLQHPHAISVFDASIEDDEPWLVMEYLPSRSLATLLGEQGPLDPRVVARIGRQLADALDAAHQAGIVHRDVKPGNVLIGRDGTVKITDFGISRATGDLTLTRTGMLAGTPAYLAPEVARGDDPTVASDVFSLGATLYAAVEGMPPFGSDDNALALLHSVAAGAVIPPAQAGPLTALLMRLLRSDPAERPTAAQARRELARIAQSPGAGSTAVWSRTRADDLGSDAVDARIPDSRRSAESDRVGSARGVRPGPPPPTWRGVPAVDGEDGLGDTLDDRSRVDVSPRGAERSRADGTEHAAEPSRPPAPRSPGSNSPSDPTTTASSSRRTRLVVVGLVTAALLAVVVAAVVLTRPSGTSATGTGASLGEAPAAPAEDGDAAMIAAVRDYYAIVTTNPAAGWARLGPDLQDEAGGFSGYQRFWGGIESVEVAEAEVVDDDTVRATLLFSPLGRAPTREIHELQLSRDDAGVWLIDEDELV